MPGAGVQVTRRPECISGRGYFFSSAFFSGSFLVSFMACFFSALFPIFFVGFFSVVSPGLVVSIFAGGVVGVGAWAQAAGAATAPTANKRVKVVIRNRFIQVYSV